MLGNRVLIYNFIKQIYIKNIRFPNKKCYIFVKIYLFLFIFVKIIEQIVNFKEKKIFNIKILSLFCLYLSK